MLLFLVCIIGWLIMIAVGMLIKMIYENSDDILSAISASPIQFVLAVLLIIVLIVIICRVAKKYMAKVDEEREKKRRQELHNQFVNKVKQRFGNSELANSFVEQFRSQNWIAVESYRNCGIYTNKIVVGNNSFVFRNYGFENLKLEDCRLLAHYFGEAYGKPFVVEKIMYYTGEQRGYWGSVDEYGHINVHPDYDTGTTIGYYLHAKSATEKPALKKW